MRRYRVRGLAVLTVIAAMIATGLACLGAAQTASAASVPNPANDAFYAQPASFSGTANGQVLDSRSVTITGLGIPLPFSAYQVKYVTENTFGTPQANVATVIKPLTTSASPKLVSYQPAIDSLSYNCDPSYTMRTGTSAETINVGVLLLKGWTVVVPDFLGPDHEWTAGWVEAKGTLDGIRAAENFAPSGLKGIATPVGLTGYSGGARGTEFANELASSYAPELNIVGAAPGGLAVDPANVGRGADGGLFAGVYFAAAIGLGRAYPSLHIDSLLNDKGKKMQAAIGDMCISQFVATYAFQKIESYTVDGVDPLTLPEVHQVMDHIRGGVYGMPKAPTYLYMATYDELVAPADAGKLVQKYCDAGLKVQYVKYPLAEHVTALVEGFPGAVSWLADRFAGKPAPSTC